LPETRIIDLAYISAAYSIGSMFVTFHAIICESQTLWIKRCWPKTDFDMK